MSREVFVTLFVVAGVIMLVGLSGFVFGVVSVIKEIVKSIISLFKNEI